MNRQDFAQLMCNHRFRRDEQKDAYVCRCGIQFTERDLVELPKKEFRELTTWMAYHAENDDPEH